MFTLIGVASPHKHIKIRHSLAKDCSPAKLAQTKSTCDLLASTQHLFLKNLRPGLSQHIEPGSNHRQHQSQPTRTHKKPPLLKTASTLTYNSSILERFSCYSGFRNFSLDDLFRFKE